MIYTVKLKKEIFILCVTLQDKSQENFFTPIDCRKSIIDVLVGVSRFQCEKNPPGVGNCLIST